MKITNSLRQSMVIEIGEVSWFFLLQKQQQRSLDGEPTHNGLAMGISSKN